MREHRLWGALTVLVIAVPAAVAVPGATGTLHQDPADAAGPLDLLRVGVDQVHRDVKLSVRTRGSFNLKALNRKPNLKSTANRYLCLRLHRSGSPRVHVLCLGTRPRGDQDTLGYGLLSTDGSLRSWQPIKATVKRANQRSVVARFRPAEADLSPAHYRWHYVSQWIGPDCPASPPAKKGAARTRRTEAAPKTCFDRAPNGRDAKLHLRSVQPIGCTHPGPSPVFHGSRRHKRVALTFDDGPSIYTPKILRILKHEHVKGTFFEIGQQVPGLASTSREVLKAGEELGDHSLHHESYPGRASIRATDRNIKRATGFAPCLFRPPGGAFNSRVVGAARSLGMTTVIWDVDPTDWSRPGTGAIYSRVVSATRPGSIVLMHDGGGNRSQTVAALPHIIHTLRGRGYSFVTVTKLLHGRVIWGPAR
jgi:peptidoglycan-N-acetylglucosamine deacetylase